MAHPYFVVAITIDEDLVLAHIERRLTTRFAHLPADRIAGAIEDARSRFEHSPVRDFVPLLVERRACEELSAELAEAG